MDSPFHNIVSEKGKEGVREKNVHKSDIFMGTPFVARPIWTNSAIVGRDGTK